MSLTSLTRNRCSRVGVLLLSTLSVAGCSPGSPGPGESEPAAKRPERTLRVALRADVTGFFPDPSMANEGFSFGINFNLFQGLVGFDRQLRIEPALAERWETPDDHTFVFTLRPGLRFSDGSPLTSDDVVASLRAATEKRWANREALQAVASIEALDGSRVSIRTRFPYLVLLSRLPRGFVLPRTAVSLDPVPPIGTGPYVFLSRERGRGFEFRANPYFSGPAPAFSHLSFKVVPDVKERIRLLSSGQTDLITDVPPAEVAGLRANPALKVASGSSTRVLFLGMRVGEKPFSNPLVREAFELAIDRAELAQRVYGGEAELATQVVGRGIVGFDPELHSPTVDRERARKLLAAAGYGKGLEVRLDGPNNRYVGDCEILAEVARQLGEVGVRVQVQGQDKNAFFALLDRRQSAFHLLGWAVETGEAGDALEYLFRTPDGAVLGTENTTGVSDRELDRLIDSASQSPVAEVRTQFLIQAMKRVAALRPVIPLVVQPEAVAFSASLSWAPPLGSALTLSTAVPVDQR